MVFGIKKAPSPAADTSELRIRKQYQNSEYSQQSGPISHIVWSQDGLNFKFHQYYGLNLKI